MKKNIIIVLLLIGIVLMVMAAGDRFSHYTGFSFRGKGVTEEFLKPIEAVDGKSFGRKGQFTFELYRNGTFIIDGVSGYAWQRSDSYRDSAIIRSTKALPRTYKVTVVAGEVDYGLDIINGIPDDPEYKGKGGPKKFNGFYFIAIADEPPVGPHTNDWWHQHRKCVIDICNNSAGAGMPNPIFMVYFDNNNELVAFNGEKDSWEYKWEKAATYRVDQWYKIEIEKTRTRYIFSISDENGNLLKQRSIGIDKVWHGEKTYPDYLVVGDPHENYYQGSMKIRSITIK